MSADIRLELVKLLLDEWFKDFEATVKEVGMPTELLSAFAIRWLEVVVHLQRCQQMLDVIRRVQIVKEKLSK